MGKRIVQFLQLNKFSLLVACSFACLSLFLTHEPEVTPWYEVNVPVMVLGALVTLVGFWVADRRMGWTKQRGFSLIVWGCALIAVMVCVVEYTAIKPAKRDWVLGALGLPALCFAWVHFFAYVIPRMREYLRRTSRADRIVAACVGVAVVCIVSGLFSVTNLFYDPVYEGERVLFDVFFTADNGHLLLRDAFFSPSCVQNDIRQPLFALIALPFSVPAKLFSYLCFFWADAYPYALCVIQGWSVYAISLLLADLLETQGAVRHLISLTFFLMSAQLLFTFLLEQYVIAVFWLLLVVRGVVGGKRAPHTAAVAAGGLTTSILIMPFTTDAYRTGKTVRAGLLSLVKGCCAGLGWFLFLIAAFGQLGQLYPPNLLEAIARNGAFLGGESSFLTVLYQYTWFLRNLVFLPEFVRGLTGGDLAIVQNAPCMRLADPTGVSVTGLVVLLVTVILFLLQKKDRFVQLCGYWVAVSAVILLFLGLGAPENGMVLYSMYFAWAVFGIWMRFFLVRIRKKRNQILFLTVVAAGLLCVNAPGVYDILMFGVQAYPV